jgi:threonine dehydratase
MTTGAGSVEQVSLAGIYEARKRIDGHVVRTPMLTNEALSRAASCRLQLKCENFQRTSSFKTRGATNAIAQLTEEERQRGVATFSAGNHGQALAYAAGHAGVACTVFSTENAVPAKMEAIRSLSAETRQYPTMQQAFEALEAMSRETGTLIVSPFADPPVIEGQGTVGLEILEDVPDVEQVIVAIGGGGLIAGIAVALRALKPDVRIVGVEPEGAPTLTRALEAGKPVKLETVSTIADGLAAPFTNPLNVAIVQEHVDDVVLVTDDEIVEAMLMLLRVGKLVAEPAGSAALAALLTGKAAVPTGAETVAIVSGGNVDTALLKDHL